MELYSELAAGVLMTLAGSYMFTEWAEGFGGRLRLKSAVLGGIISPIFTSFPELTVIVVSLAYYGKAGGSEVGVGTIIGEPLVITNAVMPVESLLALAQWRLGARRLPSLEVEGDARPLIILTLILPAVLLGQLLAGGWSRAVMAVLLLTAYGLYGYLAAGSPGPAPREVKAWASGRRGSMLLAVVAVVSLTLIYYGSVTLVGAVLGVSKALRVPAVEVSALLVPAATAIPESLASIIWVSRGLDSLGVSALLGEVILYATVYPAIGMLVTTWQLNAWALLSLIAVEASALAALAQVLRCRQLKAYQAAFLAVFMALAALASRGF